MTDLAALGLTVRSDGVVVATNSLTDFRAASEKAGQGADQLGARTDKLNTTLKKLDATAGGVGSVLKDAASRYDQLRSSVDPAFAASQKYADIQRELAAMVESGGVTQRQANIVLEQAASRLMGVSTASERAAQAQRELDAAAEQARSALAQQVASLDALRASVDPVYASSKRYEQALKQLDAALEQGLISQRQYNTILGQAEAAYLQAGTAAGQQRTAMDGLLRSSQGGAGGLQNIGFQVQDFAVQVGAGTSATQALAQQLPQLLSGFGLLGIGLGTAAAVLIPLAGYLFSSAEEAESLDDAIGVLGDSLDNYMNFTERAALSTAALTEQFGAFAGQVRGFSEFMAMVAMDQTFDDLAATIEPLKAGLAEFEVQLQNVARAREYLASASQNEDPEQFLLATEALALYQESLDDAASALGVNSDQARRLLDAMNALGQANTMGEIASAAFRAQGVMRSIRDATGQLPAPLRAAALALDQMSTQAAEAATITNRLPEILSRARDAAAAAAGAVSGIGTAAAGAVGQVQGLATAMWNMAQARLAAQADVASMQPGGAQNLANQYALYGAGRVAGEQLAREGTDLYTPFPVPDVGTGSGSSGGSSVEEYTEAQKRALEVISQVNTEAVTQAEVISALEEMHRSGAITADQLATAIGKVKEEMGDVEKVSFSLSDSLAGVFTDALTGAKNLNDGLRDLLKSMSSLFLNAAFKSFLGGIFPSIDFGGFRAGGGGVSAGKSYIVGERGPELFTPGRSGGITPNGAIGGGGTSVQINNYSGAPVREQRSRGPDGREYVKVIVGEELGSGGYDKQLGRYGATPARVKR